MIKFKKLVINNYKSISKAELLYTKGLWEVSGINNDSTFKSNGAGKSTVLEAIQQCLYNKNIKSISIEDTYNRLTKKGYSITIYFSKGQDEYTITNDRESGCITIVKNNTDISEKGIANNLKLIQTIIGFDFSTFCALTYVSHQNIVSIMESFSSSNLMKVLLDFDTISNFETVTKDSLSKSKELVQRLLQENVQINDTITLMAEFKYTDLTPMYNEKQRLQNEFFENTSNINIQGLSNKLDSLNSSIQLNKSAIQQLELKINGKTCPTCGQETTHYGDVTKGLLQYELTALLEANEKYSTDFEIAKEAFNLANEKLIILRTEFDEAIRVVDTNITIGEYKNDLYERNKGQLNGATSKLEENNKLISTEYFNQDLYDTILKTIKSGKMHKDLLDNFTKVLNTYIDDYIKYMSIDYLNVKAKASKAAIDFILYDNRTKQFIDINTLSGGELTRIRIVVLMSMLKTISTLTKMSTNILVLDEALDTLDKSAADDLASLFEYLIKSEDKFIALVSHGEQLSNIDFSGKIKAIKTNGITTIIQEKE